MGLSFIGNILTDSIPNSKDTLYNLISRLWTSLKTRNGQRKKNRLSEIQLDYAYLGIADSICYDLRVGSRVENANVFKDGIDPFMRRVRNMNTIWSRLREGTTVPYALFLRLTDEAEFMGTIMIADLLQPNFKEPATKQPACISHSSFGVFRSFFDKVASSYWRADDSADEEIDPDGNALTKLLLGNLSDICQMVVFMHFNV
ncbi:hypothetical protein BX666DRAFT_1366027 [Dichotomocladium elegans]|nr:hypothetical protein BX666DRAFT_1366027 [Dichotomocladium elegans]